MTSKTPTAARRRTAPISKRNLRSRSVSFQIDPSQPDDEECDAENGEENPDGDESGGESVADMLSILQEYKKKKSSKSSSRAAALEAKKKSIRDAAYTQINEMKATGAAYIENVKAQIDALQEEEVQPDGAFAEIAVLFGKHSKGFETHMATLKQLLAELSPVRAATVEENSANLHSHTARFAATRKRAMKRARRELHSGMEQQKLATDAQAYIKHYKHLVRK